MGWLALVMDPVVSVNCLNGLTLDFAIDEKSTVEQLKWCIAKAYHIPPAWQAIVSGSAVLQDSDVLLAHHAAGSALTMILSLGAIAHKLVGDVDAKCEALYDICHEAYELVFSIGAASDQFHPRLRAQLTAAVRPLLQDVDEGAKLAAIAVF